MSDKKIQLIRSSRGWKTIDVVELIRHKDLLYFLIKRDLSAKYAQSSLGISWAVIQPLFSSLIFTLIFGNFAKIDSGGQPYMLFSFVATVSYTYFSNTVNDAANSVVANSNIVTKVYFPRLYLPIAAAFSKSVDFVIGLISIFVIMLIYGAEFTTKLMLLPLFIMIMMMAAVGIGSWLASLAVQYRDVKHGIGFVLQALMYLSPVVYHISYIPEKYLWIYAINPMVLVIEGFRYCCLSGTQLPLEIIIPGSVTSVLLFIYGIFFFKKSEKIFSDVI